MQIILLEKVANLGNLGDVVKVKDGYARNFLIPTKQARRATAVAIKEFEARRAELGKAKTVDSVEFRGPFPEKTRFTVELPRGFKDDAGREPKNKASFALPTATDEHPPLVKFPGRFGILELQAEPVLPVTVRNVEPTVAGQKIALLATAAVPGRSLHLANDESQIMQRLQRFLNKDSEYFDRLRGENRSYPREGEISAIREGDQATAFELPRPGGDNPMEVIGIPLPKPGFYIVELASPRLGRALHDADRPYYVSTSVLVTNLAVHLKHGREGSLAGEDGPPALSVVPAAPAPTPPAAPGLDLFADMAPPPQSVADLNDDELARSLGL